MLYDVVSYQPVEPLSYQWTNHLSWIPVFSLSENVSNLNLATLYSTFTTDFSFHPPYQRVSQTIAFLDKSKTSKQDKHVKFSTTASFLEAQLMGQIKSVWLVENGRIHQGRVCKRHSSSLGLYQALYLYTTLEGCDHHVFPTNPLTGITVANCGLQTVLPKMDTRNPLQKSECFSKIYMYFCMYTFYTNKMNTEGGAISCTLQYVSCMYRIFWASLGVHDALELMGKAHWDIHTCKNFGVLKRIFSSTMENSPFKFHGFSYGIFVQKNGVSNTVSQRAGSGFPTIRLHCKARNCSLTRPRRRGQVCIFHMFFQSKRKTSAKTKWTYQISMHNLYMYIYIYMYVYMYTPMTYPEWNP